jgi:hypothetical protein
LPRIDVTFRRQLQRRDREQTLGSQPKRLPAGRKDGDGRCPLEQLREQGRSRQEVLEVVEHKQHALASERAME